VVVARLQQGKAMEAEAYIEKVLLQMNRRPYPSSLSAAMSCFWYAECQIVLQKHKIAAEHYARFVTYQTKVQTGTDRKVSTASRGWAALRPQAWKELDFPLLNRSQLLKIRTWHWTEIQQVILLW
jgi:hypothetical protein